MTGTDSTAIVDVPRRPPRASGGLPLLGHLLELRRAPIELMQRVHDECGEIGEMKLANQSVVLLSGEEAQEAFFRAPDEQLDQAAAYPFMTPVFGEGVVGVAEAVVDVDGGGVDVHVALEYGDGFFGLLLADEPVAHLIDHPLRRDDLVAEFLRERGVVGVSAASPPSSKSCPAFCMFQSA